MASPRDRRVGLFSDGHHVDGSQGHSAGTFICKQGGCGAAVPPDGRLKMEIVNLHESMMNEMIAVTDVVMPTTTSDTLVHVWRRSGVIVSRTRPDATRVRSGSVRLR